MSAGIDGSGTIDTMSGSTFISWTENGDVIGVEPVLSCTAETDRELEANFAVNVPIQKWSGLLVVPPYKPHIHSAHKTKTQINRSTD